MAGSTIHRGGTRPSRTATIGALLVVPIVLSTAVSGCRLEVEPEDDVSPEPHVAQMFSNIYGCMESGPRGLPGRLPERPSTTFVGSGESCRELHEIRGNYASKFGPGAERDSLRFESIQVRTLTPTIGIVTARWVLHRETDRSGRPDRSRSSCACRGQVGRSPTIIQPPILLRRQTERWAELSCPAARRKNRRERPCPKRST